MRRPKGLRCRYWVQPLLLFGLVGISARLLFARPARTPGSEEPNGNGAIAGDPGRRVRLLQQATHELQELRRELAQVRDDFPDVVPTPDHGARQEPEPTPAPTPAPPPPPVLQQQQRRAEASVVSGGAQTHAPSWKPNPDGTPRCKEWAQRGECDANRIWMIQNCEYSCINNAPPKVPDPTPEELQKLMAERIAQLRDPAMQCLYMYSVGSRDPGGGGAFRLHWTTQNGKPVWRRIRPPVQGGERWLYADKWGKWLVATSETEVTRQQGTLCSDKPYPMPTDVAVWQRAQGGWRNADGIELKIHTLPGCPDRPIVQLPPELIAQFPAAGWQPRKGIDYDADYEVPGLGADDPAYAYGASPAFKYPGDVELEGTVKIPFHILSHRPKIFFFPRFLTDAECDDVIATGKPLLHRSTVGQDDPGSGSKAAVSQSRTSHNAWLSDDSRASRMIMERTLAVTGFPAGGHEQLQVLRYTEGQQYTLHHDYMEGRTMQDNRVVTAFFYLTTVHNRGPNGEGGFTNWPQAGGRQYGNSTGCQSGLKTYPRKGAAIFFYDLRPDLTGDPFTIHAGCPVPPGDDVKWGGTYWLHLPMEAAFHHVSASDREYIKRRI